MNKENASLNGKTTRRNAMRTMGLGALGIAAFGPLSAKAQIAINSTETSSPYPVPQLTAIDLKILNFALNLEYLEANFYSYATTGFGLQDQGVDITGTGKQGTVTLPAGATVGTPLVTFNDPNVQEYAMEIAKDELEHVKFLRGIILNAGKEPVAQPAIDLVNSFTAAGSVAGVPGFSPFGSSAGDVNFLLGSFIFEDVGVTAYHGALASFASLKGRIAAAGIMGTEAYHASIIRSQLYDLGNTAQADALAIANAINTLGGAGIAQGLVKTGTTTTTANIVPADSNAVVYTRTTQQVLDIVYLSSSGTAGGFFPNGINS
jgi:Ferritin-like domain